MAELKSMLRLNQEPGFQGADVPDESDLYRCVHCGLCLSACPTYAHLGVETESPRGRIAFMKAVHEGRMGISDRVVSHWEMCLQCRACEAVCPSGVPYGRIMENSRAQVLNQDKQGDGLKRKAVELLQKKHPELKSKSTTQVTAEDILRFYKNTPGINEMGSFEKMEDEIRDYLVKVYEANHLERIYQKG